MLMKFGCVFYNFHKVYVWKYHMHIDKGEIKLQFINRLRITKHGTRYITSDFILQIYTSMNCLGINWYFKGLVREEGGLKRGILKRGCHILILKVGFLYFSPPQNYFIIIFPYILDIIFIHIFHLNAPIIGVTLPQ